MDQLIIEDARRIADAFKKGGKPAANAEFDQIVSQHNLPRWVQIALAETARKIMNQQNPRRRNFLGFGRSQRKEYTVDELRAMQVDAGKSLCEKEQFKRALDVVRESPSRFAKGIGARVSTAERDQARAAVKAAKKAEKETARSSYRDQYNAAVERLEAQGKKVEALEGGPNKGAYQAALRKYSEIEREVGKMKKPKKNPNTTYMLLDANNGHELGHFESLNAAKAAARKRWHQAYFTEADEFEPNNFAILVFGSRREFHETNGSHPRAEISWASVKENPLRKIKRPSERKPKPRAGESAFDYHQRVIAWENAKMPEPMRAILNERNPKGEPFPDWRKMIRHPGALHRKLGVPVGEDIPRSLIKEAIAHPERFEKTHAAQERLKKEAVLARTFEGFHHHRNPTQRIETSQGERNAKIHAYTPDGQPIAVVHDGRGEGYKIYVGGKFYIENPPRAGYTHTVDLLKKGIIQARSNPRRKNPEFELAHAEHLYEQFHGREPHRIGTFDVDTTIPADLAELGILTKIKISGSSRMLQMLTWKPIEAVRLAADPESQSLYIIGDHQRLPPNCLAEMEREFGEAAKKNQFIIGTISQITYQTKKGFDNFETIDYWHDLGEETGEKPLLVYDRPTSRLLIVGGAYKIKPAGIIN